MNDAAANMMKVAATASQPSQNHKVEFFESPIVFIRSIITYGPLSAGPGRSRDCLNPVLLYDGRCGLCNSIVRFVLDHERGHTLRFAALDSDAASRIILLYKELEDIDTVVWVEYDAAGEPSEVLVRSTAALRLARYLGGAWRALDVLRLIPVTLRDRIYDAVARNRHRIAPAESCLVPDGETRQRFLG
jgi:predicted DCC family thiol-disulfide oxidoreductase YuxK